MNKCIFLGRLVRDVETSETKSGISVATFTLAVERKFKSEDGERKTDFFNCVAFRGQAETLAEYAHKGDRLAIVASAQNETYEKDGTKRTITKFIVSEFDLLGESKKTAQNESKPPKKPRLEEIDDDFEQLPF